MTRPVGRPTDYSEDLADKICELILSGMSLARICKLDGMPEPASIYRWFRKYPEFCENYKRAKEDQADYFAEDIIDIADLASPEDVQVAKLRVDTRKWVASKFKPKKYGDTLDAKITGEGTVTFEHRLLGVLNNGYSKPVIDQTSDGPTILLPERPEDSNEKRRDAVSHNPEQGPAIPTQETRGATEKDW